MPFQPSLLPPSPKHAHAPPAGHLAAKCRLPDSPKSAVGACCLQAAGPPGLLLVADSRGCLHLISAALRSGVLPGLAPVAHFPPPGGRYHEPACLEYVAHSALARGPAVLLVLSSGEITLSRLHAKVRALPLTHCAEASLTAVPHPRTLALIPLPSPCCLRAALAAGGEARGAVGAGVGQSARLAAPCGRGRATGAAAVRQ